MKCINTVDDYWRELAGKGLNVQRGSSAAGKIGDALVVVTSLGKVPMR